MGLEVLTGYVLAETITKEPLRTSGIPHGRLRLLNGSAGRGMLNLHQYPTSQR